MADYAKMSDAELNAAVAEKVMGWRQHQYMGDCWASDSFENGYRQKHYWSPSTDIAAAMEVVDRVLELDFSCFGGMTDFELVMNPYTHEWGAKFSWSDPGQREVGRNEGRSRAICLAALAAVEAKEKTNA